MRLNRPVVGIGVRHSGSIRATTCITTQKAHTGRTATRPRVRVLSPRFRQVSLLPGMMPLQGRREPRGCRTLPGRSVREAHSLNRQTSRLG